MKITQEDILLEKSKGIQFRSEGKNHPIQTHCFLFKHFLSDIVVFYGGTF